MVNVVQYDLVRPEQHYTSLIAELKKSQGWARPVQSTWYLAGPETPQELYRRLSIHIDGNDRILVMEAKPGSSWCSSGLPEQVVTWLKANV